MAQFDGVTQIIGWYKPHSIVQATLNCSSHITLYKPLYIVQAISHYISVNIPVISDQVGWKDGPTITWVYFLLLPEA